MRNKITLSMSRCPSNTITGREDIEWANFWYSDANKNCEKGKFLIIGDSTGRKVRRTLESMAKLPVDYFGTSSGLHSLLFCSQIEAFFSINEQKYDVIYIWLGYHSLINDYGLPWEDDDFLVFEEDIRSLVYYLTQYGKRIVICSALYPVVKEDKRSLFERLLYWVKPISRLFKEKILWDEANIIKQKNDLFHRLAENESLTYCDVNSLLLSRNEHYFTRLIHSDKIHYESKSNRIIAQFFLDSLNS